VYRETLSLNIVRARIIQAHYFHRAHTALRKFANRFGRSSRLWCKRSHYVQQPRFVSTHSLLSRYQSWYPLQPLEPRWLKMVPRNTPS
jgi:hypothetical protein